MGTEKANWSKLIDSLIEKKLLCSAEVIRSMCSVPRAKFLPVEMQEYNSNDTPLLIGFGQSMPSPQTVSRINEALGLQVGCKVLEIGAGSGWHSATIAEIVAPQGAPRSQWGHVYTLEIIQSLAENARKNIMKAGYGDRVTIINNDGAMGYPAKAPYDRILVSASVPKIPKSITDQLKPQGVMVIPVGSPILFQKLIKLTKTEDGTIKQENIGNVTFGPLKGDFSQ